MTNNRFQPKTGGATTDLHADKWSDNKRPVVLYVGDLDSSVTEEELKQLFSEKGDVVSTKISTDETGESLSSGYIEFSTQEDAKHALEALNFTLVHGKQIRVAYSCQDPSSCKDPAANLFVKNLDKTLGHQELYNLFATYGAILSCKVRKDASGESKGFGYVQFENEECARKAIEELNGATIHGKELYVGPFLSKEERQKDIGGKFTNVYVKNLIVSITEEDLRNHFGGFGSINNAVVMKDDNGNSKGFGFVSFQKPEDASKAIESLHGSLFHGEKLYVSIAQRKSEREVELKRVRETIGTTSFHEPINLYVKNLDDDVDDDKLKLMFSPFGTITSCKVMLNKVGMSKGFGFVSFSTAHEGARAILEMNGKVLGRHPLYVAVAEKQRDTQAMFSRNVPCAVMPTLAQPQVFNHQLPSAFMPLQIPSTLPLLPQPMVQGIGSHHPFGYMITPLPIPVLFPHPQMQQQMMPVYLPFGHGSLMPNAHPHSHTGGRPHSVQRKNGSSKLDKKKSSGSMSGGAGTSTGAGTTLASQKKEMGERLFPLVEKQVDENHEMAQKITSMLLDMDLEEVRLLIESPKFLQEKVDEAMEVLKNASSEERRD